MFNLILAHFFGDFLLQSHFMAERKLKEFWVCVFHVTVYTIPFYFMVSANWKFLCVIASTHLIIDYFKVAEKVSWLKNVSLNPNLWREAFFVGREEVLRYHYNNCKYGYPQHVPEHLSLWLMIIVDQILHILTNYWIYRYFIGV